MSRVRVLAVSLIAGLVVGCAGTPFQREDTQKVRSGMTEAEVVSILGNPYSRSQSGDRSVLTWSYADAFGTPAKAVSYTFRGGRVIGASTVGR
jgi:outer membrane protein assembly factor BamE (lipoprotein component of BamABCDE complex)